MKRFYHAFTSSEFWIAFGIMFLSLLGLSMPCLLYTSDAADE